MYIYIHTCRAQSCALWSPVCEMQMFIRHPSKTQHQERSFFVRCCLFSLSLSPLPSCVCAFSLSLSLSPHHSVYAHIHMYTYFTGIMFMVYGPKLRVHLVLKVILAQPSMSRLAYARRHSERQKDSSTFVEVLKGLRSSARVLFDCHASLTPVTRHHFGLSPPKQHGVPPCPRGSQSRLHCLWQW